VNTRLLALHKTPAGVLLIHLRTLSLEVLQPEPHPVDKTLSGRKLLPRHNHVMHTMLDVRYQVELRGLMQTPQALERLPRRQRIN
jgi:hypothetical protein